MKKILFGVFLAALFLAQPAFAAIAFDTAVEGGTVLTTSLTTLTWSHTVTGTNPILIVSVLTNNNCQVSGTTYDGLTMTLLAQTTELSSACEYMFYLLNPPTGAAHNVVVTFGNASGRVLGGESASYTGVSQTSFPDSFNDGGGVGATISATTDVVASNAWLVSAVWSGSSGVATAGTNCTVRENQTSIGNGLCDSNGTVGTGNQTATASQPSGDWGMITASLAPATSVTSKFYPWQFFDF